MMITLAPLVVVAFSASSALSAAPSTSSRPLLQSELHLLSEQRFVSIPRWLSDAQIDGLQADAIACGRSIGATECGVGREGRVNERVRLSRECSFYPPPPNAAGVMAERAALIEVVRKLRGELQASSTLDLPYLEPFETELAYLLYPVGGHYKRHLDVPHREAGWKLQGRASSDGGSFCGGRTRRVVSFILYLNRAWPDANGGKLRVYEAHDVVASRRDLEADDLLLDSLPAHAEDITPEGGTLVLLMSSDIEHMVRETHGERQCIVGWFNEYREERVDDCDTFGTRTR